MRLCEVKCAKVVWPFDGIDIPPSTIHISSCGLLSEPQVYPLGDQKNRQGVGQNTKMVLWMCLNPKTVEGQKTFSEQ